MGGEPFRPGCAERVAVLAPGVAERRAVDAIGRLRPDVDVRAINPWCRGPIPARVRGVLGRCSAASAALAPGELAVATEIRTPELTVPCHAARRRARDRRARRRHRVRAVRPARGARPTEDRSGGLT